jgi:hypothetical protein
MSYSASLLLAPLAYLHILPGCFLSQVPITPFDNNLALSQMECATTTLLNRQIVGKTAGKNTVLGKDGHEHPRIVRSGSYFFPLYYRLLKLPNDSLGGDHTIVLPILRALNKVYGQPISVIHFGNLSLHHVRTHLTNLCSLRLPFGYLVKLSWIRLSSGSHQSWYFFCRCPARGAHCKFKHSCWHTLQVSGRSFAYRDK